MAILISLFLNTEKGAFGLAMIGQQIDEESEEFDLVSLMDQIKSGSIEEESRKTAQLLS